MSLSLYRKYRPQTFSDLTGQKTAVEVISNSVIKSTVGHAYLFSGSRGCGKTSAARIFAKALNCTNRNGYEPCGECTNCKAITAGDSLDVIEIDGASNNGVENIRGLKESVTLAPFNSKYKIYIIDEVHMLSTGAFNALLKTLEEPPDYVIFIMATTEPQKVPVTIRSRCQHIPFHSITPEDIFARLNYVCDSEGVSAESDALREISRQAEGALRDALSLLEQVIAAGDVTLSNVERVTGSGSRPAFERWIKTFRTDFSEGYVILKGMFDSGASGLRVFEEMFSLVRDLWLTSKWSNMSVSTSEQEKEFLNEEVSHWKTNELHKLLNVIVKMLSEARRGVKPDILLGMFMLYLEAEPEESSVPLMPKTLNIKPPERTVTKPEPEPEKNDDLKEKILETVHSNNFLIYSALLDSDVYSNGEDLTFRMRHIYCYSWFKASRNAADLRAMFKDYRSVIIRHGQESIVCPEYESGFVSEPEETKPAVTSVRNTSPEPEAKSESKQESKPEPYVSYGSDDSKIGKFIRELTFLNAKPELLMRRKNENESEDDNAEEGETEE